MGQRIQRHNKESRKRGPFYYRTHNRAYRLQSAWDQESYTPIPESTAGKLKAIWTVAINSAEENDMTVLDGCSYEFFANGKKAQTHGFKENRVRVPRLTALADSLMLLTKEGDANALQQLQGEIDELYMLFCGER